MTKVVKSNRNRKAVNSKIRGVDVDTTRFRFNQTPVETPDGANKVFTLPNSESYVTGILEVFVDGLQQIKTTDWTETSSTTFSFVAAPDSDENIRLNYIKQ